MIALKNVLIALDFSDPSVNALRYAQALARHFEGTLHVLHVLEDPLLHAAALGGFVPAVWDSLGAEKAAQDHLRRAVPPAAGDRVEHVTRIGNPFLEIVGYARERNIDLIVLGTHGRRGVRRLLMGSVSEGVLARTSKPVLLVRSEAEG